LTDIFLTHEATVLFVRDSACRRTDQSMPRSSAREGRVCDAMQEWVGSTADLLSASQSSARGAPQVSVERYLMDYCSYHLRTADNAAWPTSCDGRSARSRRCCLSTMDRIGRRRFQTVVVAVFVAIVLFVVGLQFGGKYCIAFPRVEQ